MKWGLVPWWAPDSSMGQRMINARSQTPLKKVIKNREDHEDEGAHVISAIITTTVRW